MLSNMPVEVTLRMSFFNKKRVEVPMVSMDNKPTMVVGNLEICPCLKDYRALCEGRTVTFGTVEGIKVSGRRADLEA